MTSLERYYGSHLRSLFISKFRYRAYSGVTQIKNMRWVFLAKPSFYPLAALMCFVVTGKWPVHKRIRRYVRGSRSASSLLQLTVRFGDSFSRSGLRLLHKCKFLYFPYVDSALLSSDGLFDAFYAHSTSISVNWQLFLSTFQELEVLVGSNLSAVQAAARTMHFKCFFTLDEHSSVYQLMTAVRALQLPLAENSSLVRSCSNAAYSWTGGRLALKGPIA